ncbi:hypothetical protein AQUCO_00100645v1 [Aquilegia coerulea]|uniref:Uncharacterized protein n=1 Tax=Aquilegia coerulea TaxID=218851 RepID=A0A2G5FBN7_AQUCA|nr:hypothetical protein AQUCO_00100645v1 [Aquilegia coerulea]
MRLLYTYISPLFPSCYMDSDRRQDNYHALASAAALHQVIRINKNSKVVRNIPATNDYLLKRRKAVTIVAFVQSLPVIDHFKELSSSTSLNVCSLIQIEVFVFVLIDDFI